MLKPLKLPVKNWRSRWVACGRSRVLHRVAEAKWDNVAEYGGSLVEGRGRTVCGMAGEIRMPGIFNRMEGKRCVACGKALALPPGYGAPFNDKKLTKKQQTQ